MLMGNVRLALAGLQNIRVWSLADILPISCQPLCVIDDARRHEHSKSHKLVGTRGRSAGLGGTAGLFLLVRVSPQYRAI